MDETPTSQNEAVAARGVGTDHAPTLAARFGVMVVRLYQATLGPFLGGHCRYQPTCSHYAIDALRSHGLLRGMWLTGRRLLRCHPWGGVGYDPVPPRRTAR